MSLLLTRRPAKQKAIRTGNSNVLEDAGALRLTNSRCVSLFSFSLFKVLEFKVLEVQIIGVYWWSCQTVSEVSETSYRDSANFKMTDA